MILVYLSLIIALLSVSGASVRMLPYAIIASGYYVYFLLSGSLVSKPTWLTSAYWVFVDLMAFLFLCVRRGSDYIFHKNIMVLLIIFFLIVIMNALFVSNMSGYTIKKIGFAILIAYTPYFLSAYVQRSDDENLIHAITVLSTAMNIITLIAFALAGTHLKRFTFIEPWQPIYSAITSALSAIGGMWLLRYGKRKSMLSRLLCYGAIVLAFISIFITSERGPLLSLIVAIIMLPPFPLAVFSGKRLALVSGVILLTVITFLLNPNTEASKRVMLLFDSSSGTSMSAVHKSTVQLRIERYKIALMRGADNPLTGIGIGNTREEDYAHNSVLETFEELGFIGALTFLSVLVVAFSSVLSRRSNAAAEAGDGATYFWDCTFLFATAESLISLTIFGFPLFWLSLGMATRKRMRKNIRQELT